MDVVPWVGGKTYMIVSEVFKFLKLVSCSMEY